MPTPAPPRDLKLVDPLEQIVVAGVGMTTRALAEAAPGVDLSFPQWRVMVILDERPDGVTVSQIAARLGVTVPATSRQLKRLERRGLVLVGPDPVDRRAVRARLSPLGIEVREAILAHRRARLAESVVSVGDRQVTHDALNRIAAALSEYR